MKKLKLYTYIRPAWIFIVGILLSVMSCMSEPFAGKTDSGQEEETVVRLSISTPKTSLPKALFLRSEGQDLENKIAEIKVMVFRKEGGDYLYQYMVDGQRLQMNMDQTTQFEAVIHSSDSPLKLLLLANYMDVFENYVPEMNGNISDIIGKMTGSFTGIFDKGLPMYAEIDLPGGIQAENTNVLRATMLRAIARVDIMKDLDSDSKSFEAREIYLYRAKQLVQIVPNPETLSGSAMPLVMKASVPAEAGIISAPFYQVAGKESMMIERLYVPEAFPLFDETEQTKEAVCIVVGGLYDGRNEMTYYRIDFNSGHPEHPFGQILRNHKYLFQIKKVLGLGWPSPDEAANNYMSGIIADIQAWEDFTMEMYFNGDNYLGVSDRFISMKSRANDEKAVDVQSTLPYTIQWFDGDGNLIGTPVSIAGQAISDGNFNASIVHIESDEADVSHVLFSTIALNSSNNDIKGKLRIAAGPWYFDIDVTQDNDQKYIKEFVRVMSIQEVGDLGDPMASNANGRAMREVLEHADNFSPTGKVKIGGFVFNRIVKEGTAAQPANVIAYNTMKSQLYGSDVLYLTYNNTLSDYVAQLILKWLEDKPTRVLIVGGDSPTTSQPLFDNYLSGDVDWWHFGSGSKKDNLGQTGEPYRGGYARAEETKENKEFFEGPFGSVALDMYVDRNDIIAGYAKSFGEDVTPLLMISGYPGYMNIGVNKKKRIIYMGDGGSLHYYNSGRNLMSSNTGVVSNDLDRLLANIWAWIAEQVVSGE